jgi:hypothetical protein
LSSIFSNRCQKSGISSTIVTNWKGKGVRLFKDKIAIGVFDLEWHKRKHYNRRVLIHDTFTDDRYRIIIQSEKPPTHLEEKIEIFLDLLRDGITEMSDEDYASHISSLVLSLSETPKFLGKETWRYWSHIDSGFYDFKRRKFSRFL